HPAPVRQSSACLIVPTPSSIPRDSVRRTAARPARCHRVAVQPAARSTSAPHPATIRARTPPPNVGVHFAPSVREGPLRTGPFACGSALPVRPSCPNITSFYVLSILNVVVLAKPPESQRFTAPSS